MSKKLVLCIDDRSTNAEVRKLLLECEGYRVLMAMDGNSGLSLFAIHSVDAVLLDYDTAHMNGTAVAARMRELKPQVPIIMLSARSVPPKGIKNLVDVYISKGENPTVLLDRIEELLKRT